MISLQWLWAALPPVGGWAWKKGSDYVGRLEAVEDAATATNIKLDAVQEDVTYVRGRIDNLTDHLIPYRDRPDRGRGGTD